MQKVLAQYVYNLKKCSTDYLFQGVFFQNLLFIAAGVKAVSLLILVEMFVCLSFRIVRFALNQFENMSYAKARPRMLVALQHYITALEQMHLNQMHCFYDPAMKWRKGI